MNTLLFFSLWFCASLPFAGVLLAINACAKREADPLPVSVFKDDSGAIAAATCGDEEPVEFLPWEGPNEFAPCDCPSCDNCPFAG